MAFEKKYSYLDLLVRKLDLKQRTACCRTENTIVAAGAGSGKTQVLATRFAWLVMSEGIPVSKILTLTFTRKAAAEMYQRIYQTLAFFAGNENTPPLERERAAIALGDFSEAHIQTLDSYRSTIVRQAANRYGIRPDFGSDDGKLDLSLLALEFVMKKISSGTEDEIRVIRHFAGTNGLQDFAEKFIATTVSEYSSLAAGKDHFSSMLPRQLDYVRMSWNSLSQKLAVILCDVSSRLKGDGADAIVALEGISGRNLPEGKDARTLASVTRSAISKLLPFVERTDGKPRSKFEEIDEVLRGLFGLSCYVEEYPYICGLYRLLDEFASMLNRSKRLSGKLSFKDIADMAMRILIEQEDIRSQEKMAYSKIMIDEFQDNNGRDRDLLYLLAEREDFFVRPDPAVADSLHQALRGNIVGDKLFFVGDEKQSIYKFRGADVAVFNQLKDDLGTGMLQMNNNYRSLPELLSFFNQLFGGFLPSGDDCSGSFVFGRESQDLFGATYPSEAKASKVDTNTHADLELPFLKEDNCKARVCMFNSAFLEEDKGTDSLLPIQDQIAYFIASKIKLAHDADSVANPYSSFAVLDRSRTDRSALIRWMSVFGIPYSLDQQGALFQEAPVNDVYAMLRLCVYPSDKKAFTSVLASPFVSLSDTGCQLVLAGYAARYDKGQAWQAFSPKMDEALRSDLSPEEYGRYKDAGGRFALFREESLQDRICRTLDRLWNASGYRYNLLLGQSESLLSEHFDLLFEMARKADEAGHSLAWFVDQLGAIRDKRPGFFKVDLDEDISNVEYPVEKSDSVSVMTIHKSKGLQFRHVFVLGCCGGVKSEAIEDFFFDVDYGLSVRLRTSGGNPFFERRKDELKRMAEEEFKRIFYVAVTRAEEDVCIVGDWKETKTEKDMNELPMMQRIICSYYEDARSAAFQVGKDVFVPGAPFFFQSIQPVSKEDAYKGRKGGHDEVSLVRKAEAVFAGDPSVEYERPVSDRMKPSSLKSAGKPEEAGAKGLYPRLGLLLEKYGGEVGEDDESVENIPDGFGTVRKEFSSASFGSLAHSYFEAFADGIALEEFKPDRRLLQDLSKGDAEEVCGICVAMTERLFVSNTGKAFLDAKKAGRLAVAEYPFRMRRDGLLYTGSIDLLFQDGDGSYVIVDYKTHPVINRESHRGQLECYRDAVSQIFCVDPDGIRMFLYYPRFDQAVEL